MLKYRILIIENICCLLVSLAFNTHLGRDLPSALLASITAFVTGSIASINFSRAVLASQNYPNYFTTAKAVSVN